MKRSGPIQRRTPLRNKKPFRRGNVPAADALMGIWGLKRVKASPRDRESKPAKRLPRVKKGRCGTLERECEVLWAVYIKLRYGNKSVLSGAGGLLDAAHVYGRGRLTTKFHLLNGIPLTRLEATYFTDHPTEFYAWVRHWWPHTELTVEALERLSNTITHPTEDWFLQRRDELRASIQALKDATLSNLF